jgi:hypothetical protein
MYDFVYSTYLAAATAPTWGPTGTATTAAAMGPALSAAASGFLREILMDLGLEPAVAAAEVAAFLWGELMAKALALAAAPWSPTGEAVLPANEDVATVTETATALEDAWHLCLEAALAAAAANAFLWGELMAKAMALTAAPLSPTGEAVLPTNGDAATGTGTATALEDAWRRVVMPTTPATGNADATLIEDTAASSVGGQRGAAPDGRTGGEGAPPPLEPFLTRVL